MAKQLKNFGMITEAEFTGLSLEEARNKAENDGFVVRIVENNGEPFILTTDYYSDRINFRVRNNKVIGVYGG